MTAVRQRTLRDCGISALAILLADAIARRVDPEMRGLNGLYNRELVAAAGHLGFQLRSQRNFDMDTDEGLLRVRWKGDRRKGAPHGHWVTLIQAAIHDPADATVLPWRDYVARFDAQPMTLLKVNR
jgi:hypothetical protein